MGLQKHPLSRFHISLLTFSLKCRAHKDYDYKKILTLHYVQRLLGGQKPQMSLPSGVQDAYIGVSDNDVYKYKTTFTPAAVISESMNCKSIYIIFIFICYM